VDGNASALRRMGWYVFFLVLGGWFLAIAEPRLCRAGVQTFANDPASTSESFWCVGGNAFLAIALAAVALVVFFGFLSFGTGSERIRTAIAVALVTVYVLFVCMTAFFGPTTGEEQHLPPLSEAMVASFTATIATVIAFYFGASAYVQAAGAESDQSEETQTQPGQPGRGG
jgi:hypothetical protein